jgi:hypothetical protein
MKTGLSVSVDFDQDLMADRIGKHGGEWIYPQVQREFVRRLKRLVSSLSRRVMELLNQTLIKPLVLQGDDCTFTPEQGFVETERKNGCISQVSSVAATDISPETLGAILQVKQAIFVGDMAQRLAGRIAVQVDS